MTSNPMLVALVLAAGQSSRFGGDKRRALLPDGRTVLNHTLSYIAPHVDRIVVALKPNDRQAQWRAESDVDWNKIESCYCDHAGDGLSGSIRDGLFYVRRQFPAVQGVLVALADMPFVKTTTVGALVAQFAEDKIVRPKISLQEGSELVQRAGHPVLFGRDWLPALSRCRGDTGARDLLKTNAQAVIGVEVSDTGILLDVDKPEDLPKA